MLKKIINIGLAYSAVVSIVVLYQRIEASLNGGACPLHDQRGWIYSAIAVALTALLLSYIDGKNK